MAYFQLFLAAVLALPSAAAAGAKKLPQDRCYCVQFTGKPMQPYFIGKLSPEPAACEGVKYEPAGKSPFELGLPPCEALKRCSKPSATNVKKRKTLEEKLAQGWKKKQDCKDAGKTSGDCAGDWDGALKVLTAELEKLDAADASAREECLLAATKPGRRVGSGN